MKCRGFKENGKCFDFKCSDVQKHLNMQKFTNTPILIAVYESRNDRPVFDKAYFFPIDLLLDNPDISTNYRKGIGDCYKVPISLTHIGFELIDSTFEQISGGKGKSYTIEQKRLEHPNAYMPWTDQETNLLKELVETGKSVKDIASQLGRKNSAIRSRILKINEGR